MLLYLKPLGRFQINQRSVPRYIVHPILRTLSGRTCRTEIFFLLRLKRTKPRLREWPPACKGKKEWTIIIIVIIIMFFVFLTGGNMLLSHRHLHKATTCRRRRRNVRSSFPVWANRVQDKEVLPAGLFRGSFYPFCNSEDPAWLNIFSHQCNRAYARDNN